MATGNFSNEGVDTFDPARRFVGVRLQQGVPLLDRDWNEAEDIRRYFERSLRSKHVGQGVHDQNSFKIAPPPTPVANDFLIQAGHVIVDGWEIDSPTPMLFSQQPGGAPLPAADATTQTYVVYLDTTVSRIGSADDPTLKNSQDINLETCLRDRLDWSVRVARSPEHQPGGAYVLANITRPPNASVITADMITDKRRIKLNLAETVDRATELEKQVAGLTNDLHDATLALEQLRQQVARMFWDVALSSSKSVTYFGDSIAVTATVVDGIGQAVPGAQLYFTSDWGVLDPAFVATDQNGKATITLHGVSALGPPPKQEMAVLNDIARRVELTKLGDGATIQHRLLRFQPPEMTLVSRYIHPMTLIDLAPALATPTPHATIPTFRTVTVSVHSREGQGTIVRGIGSIQVRFGMWVRDWAISKIVDTVSNIQVAARVGDLLRQGVAADPTFTTAAVSKITSGLPTILQQIHDDTFTSMKKATFFDPTLTDDLLAGSGQVGEVIAREATAAIGQLTTQALSSQYDQLKAPQDSRSVITQTSHQISSGFSQSQKQLYNAAKLR